MHDLTLVRALLHLDSLSNLVKMNAEKVSHLCNLYLTSYYTTSFMGYWFSAPTFSLHLHSISTTGGCIISISHNALTDKDVGMYVSSADMSIRDTARGILMKA